jgi:predicted alternative tryptophan synthase beta-subunit
MAKKFDRTMFFLDQKDMPTHWYNIQADLPEPLPRHRSSCTPCFPWSA